MLSRSNTLLVLYTCMLLGSQARVAIVFMFMLWKFGSFSFCLVSFGLKLVSNKNRNNLIMLVEELLWSCINVYLSHFLQPNAETEDGITPLLSSVAAGSLACLELLIQVT